MTSPRFHDHEEQLTELAVQGLGRSARQGGSLAASFASVTQGSFAARQPAGSLASGHAGSMSARVRGQGLEVSLRGQGLEARAWKQTACSLYNKKSTATTNNHNNSNNNNNSK
ncbi:unnamed protein product [Polarella glacialis]|uniref:Uncharacterized protein n=1 Tax=Polarella glacialis TaxID=89957 RepID=A0A813JMH5_POLGL|nr:unnamed protein product [Polarella glacialis]